MEYNLHRTFRALGDPTRLAVVERLLEGPATVSDLARPHGIALPAFTKHLGVLERAGLITSAKSGRVRTCAVDPAMFTALDRWFLDRRAMWERRLDRLDHLLASKD